MIVNWSNLWSLILGFALGWGFTYLKCRIDLLTAERDRDRERRRDDDSGMQWIASTQQRGWRAWFVRDNLAVLVSLAVVIAGIFWMNQENQQRDQDKNCLRHNLIEVVQVINARAAISERHNSATNALDNAQARFLSTIADPKAPEAVQRQAFLDYLKAVQKRQAQARQETRDRAATPPPSESDISQC